MRFILECPCCGLTMIVYENPGNYVIMDKDETHVINACVECNCPVEYLNGEIVEKLGF
jgi:hypothetical protein